jgi:hypothetical protein
VTVLKDDDVAVDGAPTVGAAAALADAGALVTVLKDDDVAVGGVSTRC